ncbi:hypothetical protein PDM24_09685 [Bacteroides fragilis]|jgi:hypothetical protein|uniref:Uncharacterized protein n=2 Tax=Bacteroides fragilis TaxID=817 RepID=A0A413JTT1_BACFG|nr:MULTISPECIES: hypothetical protein [Bacteroides]EKA82108.1 hypothetical protein HMPREF1205_04066 [Bacteroides fragilis HMW 616]MBU3040777.1 hypothetical protein [Bacteroides sp. HF-4919]MBY2893862.1 hypothetical protein [Bacteroides fragilis]MCE8632844.1 hypothetical protein [Bacteroides fragilis]MCE8683740.1 hypothetical protein [Bacteroides fragilis]
MNKKSLNSFLKESFCTLCKNMKYKKSSIVVNDILFKTTNLFILCFLFITCFISCQDEQLILESPVSTRSIPTPTFDWENADWMPTPSGQSRIPSPWVGQGSIASIYGMDVINDRKSSDGWVLLYNTFETKASGPLVNPYFILYNKYRGIMRIFLYTTTQFISPSTYLQDGISIISNHKSSLLNFMGEAIVDGSKNKETYSQMQPAPDDGSLPLASNKWYMMQYELAYDEQIAQLPYNSIQLNWYMNYYNVEKIDLNGDFVGTIKSAIGSSSGNNIFSGLGNVGKVTGTGILAGIGDNFLYKNTINEETGENKLGLPKSIFKSAVKGIKSAISKSSSDLPGAIIGAFSAMFSSGNGESKLINLNIDAKITLEGTAKSSGSFPGSPISFWIPGTSIPSSATGYIPYYQESLGVFNFIGKPKIEVTGKGEYIYYDYFDETPVWATLNFPKLDLSQYIRINPTLKNIADIQIREANFLLVPYVVKDYSDMNVVSVTCDSIGEGYINTYTTKYYVNPTEIFYRFEDGPSPESAFDFYARIILDVKPYNGSPTITIEKLFLLEQDFSKVNVTMRNYH